MHQTTGKLTFCFLALAAFNPTGFGQCQEEVLSESGSPIARYGQALDMYSDNLLVVGAPGDSGASESRMYIYRNSGGSWNLERTDFVSNASDGFGSAVAIHGDYCAIGAPFSDSGLVDSGVVFVYKHNAGTWSLIQTLSSLPTILGSFGAAVEFGERADGLHLYVGQPGAERQARARRLDCLRLGRVGSHRLCGSVNLT